MNKIGKQQNCDVNRLKDLLLYRNLVVFCNVGINWKSVLSLFVLEPMHHGLNEWIINPLVCLEGFKLVESVGRMFSHFIVPL